METKFKLIDVVKSIETIAKTKAVLDPKFELEYLIGNIQEEQLLTLGFKYIGKSSYNICPTYQMNNIFAFFDEGILHVSETIN